MSNSMYSKAVNLTLQKNPLTNLTGMSDEEALRWIYDHKSVHPQTGCWTLPGAPKVGQRGIVCVWYEGHVEPIYRAVWKLAGYSLERDQLICHTCLESSCFNPDHHYIGDHLDNKAWERHSKRGRQSRLSDEVLEEIYQKRLHGATWVDLGDAYNYQATQRLSRMVTRWALKTGRDISLLKGYVDAPTRRSRSQPLTFGEAEKIWDLALGGYSSGSIESALGISASTVRKVLKGLIYPELLELRHEGKPYYFRIYQT